MSFLNNIFEKRKLLIFIFISIFIGGIFSFFSLGKLEDAEIPIKVAVVMTVYPGASAHEVELEVTDVLEKEIQRLENIDYIESRSMAGFSEITIYIKETVNTQKLPQLWDHLRRKVSDAQNLLPQGASPPIVNDDFGDVNGIFLAMSAEGYSYETLRDYAYYLKRELSLVDGVRRITITGEKTPCINIEFNTNKLTNLGVNPKMIIQAIQEHSKVVNSGSIISGTDRIYIEANGKFTSPEDIENLLITTTSGDQLNIRDVAEINESYLEPIRTEMHYNTKPALGIAISMENGGNVIKLGEKLEKKLEELEVNLPIGIEFNKVFYQPERVSNAISDFMMNLISSVLIVVAVLLFSMGLRTGLLIASGLVFTILGTFIIMLGFDITLQRVSLAAIIIAMGMLVDNSIVVADGILVDLKKKMPRPKALVNSAKVTAMPLLGATIVAILAFLPLALSPNSAGEFLRSLFYVLAISLFLSWILAMVQTPFFANYMVNFKKKNKSANPYEGKLYVYFERFIKYTLKHRALTVIIFVVILFSAFYNFKNLKVLFMPDLDYDQFIVEYWLPAGSDSKQVSEDLLVLEKELIKFEDVHNITAAVGATPTRYTLVRPMNNLKSNYGELIIDATDFKATRTLAPKIQSCIDSLFPDSRNRVRYYNPISGETQIEVKFSGPDPAVLRKLAEKAKEIMRNEPKATYVKDNWSNKVKTITPVYSQELGRKAMINRSDIAYAMSIATNGLTVGAFYDGTYSLPIVLKLDEQVNNKIEQISTIPVWGMSNQSVPLSQVTEKIEVEFKDEVIHRYNNRRAILAQCDPNFGYTAPMVVEEIMGKINAIELPNGYEIEWLGEHKNSKDANEALFKFLPLSLIIMVIIIIALFNSFRETALIFMIIPMALIGVVYGLLLTGKPFGFAAIIGTLGLMGMMIKNSVVLIDQINIELNTGKVPLQAVIDSAISRMRPVLMASLTTILGMIPLINDPMFGSMSVVIMSGLLIGSVITLIIIPVLYTQFFRISNKELKVKSIND